MELDTTTMTLWQKIAAISKEVGHIEKTGKNSHFNYNFIEHSNVVATLRPMLDLYGVTIDLEAMDATFTPGDRSTRVLLHMRYTVTNADKPEETFNRLWVSEAMDQQDKGINKALTAAEKNVFMKLFHISDVDPDGDEGNQTQGKGKPQQAPTPPTKAPVTQSRPQTANITTQPSNGPRTAPAPTPTPDYTPAPEKVTEKEIKAIRELAGVKGVDEIALATRCVKLFKRPVEDLELDEARNFYRQLQQI